MSNGIPLTSTDNLAFRESMAYLLSQESRKVYVIGFSLGGNILANILPDFEGKI
jgi:predicted alpha/beta-fold hydrolase